MGQDINKIAKMYDTVAREYAEKFSDEHQKKPMDQEMLQRFSKRIGDKSPLWDLGCGPAGQTARYLKDLGLQISGLDLSEKNLQQARTLHPQISFQKGDLLCLDFENDSIAGAVSFYSIVHFTKEQVKTAFQEVFRVLEPGGIFLLTYHIGEKTLHIEEFLNKQIDIDFMFFTTEFISSCLKKSGFESIEIIERQPYPEIEYESRRAYIFAIKPSASKVG